MIEGLTSAQLRAGRALVNWTVRDLARRTNVHRNTISAFESGKSAPNHSTRAVLRAALEEAGVEFIDGEAPGARLSKPRPQGPGYIPTGELNAENDK